MDNSHDLGDEVYRRFVKDFSEAHLDNLDYMRHTKIPVPYRIRQQVGDSFPHDTLRIAVDRGGCRAYLFGVPRFGTGLPTELGLLYRHPTSNAIALSHEARRLARDEDALTKVITAYLYMKSQQLLKQQSEA